MSIDTTTILFLLAPLGAECRSENDLALLTELGDSWLVPIYKHLVPTGLQTEFRNAVYRHLELLALN